MLQIFDAVVQVDAVLLEETMHVRLLAIKALGEQATFGNALRY